MSRPLRIEYPDAVYHVTSRGNARNDIFHADQDRKEFLSILDRVVRWFNWICHAYCLMDNHYHLLIETPDGNLSQGMRQLNGIYTEHAPKHLQNQPASCGSIAANTELHLPAGTKRERWKV